MAEGKNQIINKTRQSYLEKENVKEFNNEVLEHTFKKIGRPYAFNSVEQLSSDILEYFKLCERTSVIPTVTGLSVWLKVHIDTIYSHIADKGSPFSELLKSAIDICHLSLENGAIDNSVNSITYIFIAKNRFNMQDQTNITLSPKNTNDQPNTIESYDAIKEQLTTEHTKQLIEHSEE